MAKSLSISQPNKNISVVIEINGGSFAVTLKILENGHTIQEDVDFVYFPAVPEEIPNLYQEWQETSQENSRQLQAVPLQVTNVAKDNWREKTRRLETLCRSWFQDQAFGRLCDRIRANNKVFADQSVPIIIRCNTRNAHQNELLRRLPWHLWDLFTYLPNSEFALFTKFSEQVPALKASIRVLAIFGSSHGGLQLKKDEAALELLKQRGAEIIKELEPTAETLYDRLFNEAWDILFFAGHSSSIVESGQIQISQHVCLPLNDLHRSLSKAVKNGLKLAIFNSCDGLGIADFLAELNVPAMIVMREPVPDQIAYKFLLHFLEQFSQGIPLCLAVREARDRLACIQSTFPAASWLPVVCLNPNQPELVWPAPLMLPWWLSCRLRLHFMIGLTALSCFIVVATTITFNRCQIFSSFCIPVNDNSIDNFISDGKKLIAGNSIVRLNESSDLFLLKQQGIKEFSEDKYATAVNTFDRLLSQAKENKNVPNLRLEAFKVLQDPEIRIYRNNALVNNRRTTNPNLPIYTIAVAAPLNLDAGLNIVQGVAQAQDVAVNKGINLQVVIANDSNKPDQARRVAEKLSKNENILAVVGHYTSPNTCEALNVYSQAKLVLISPTSSVVNLRFNPHCQDYNKVFFRTNATTRVEAKSLVNFLVNDLKKSEPKVVVFYNNQELFSKDLFNEFNKALQEPQFRGKVIGLFNLSDQNFDTSQFLPLVKDADALAVLVDGETDNDLAFKNAINVIKLKEVKKTILGSNTLYLRKVINQTGRATVNHLFMAVNWHHEQCGAKEFKKQIIEYWHGDLSQRTSQSYEAVQVVLEAIKQSNSPMSRENIRQKLSEITSSSAMIEGLSISFDKNGDRNELKAGAIATVNNELKLKLVHPCPQ